MKTLTEAIHSLPPELYREIYDLTFTTPRREQHRIDGAYKPPSCLHVNRETRETFAKSFYGSIFIVCDIDFLRKWCTSLPRAHTAMLREMRVAIEAATTVYQASKVPVDINAVGVMFAWLVELEMQGTRVNTTQMQHALKFKVSGVEEASTTWMGYRDTVRLISRNNLRSPLRAAAVAHIRGGSRA